MIYLIPIVFLAGVICGGLLVDARRKRRIKYLDETLKTKADALIYHREQHMMLMDERDRTIKYLRDEISLIDEMESFKYDYMRARRTALQGLLLKLQGRI